MDSTMRKVIAMATHRPYSTIHRAVNDFMTQGRALLDLLRSPEGVRLSELELHNLRVYLDLLGIEAVKGEHTAPAPPKGGAGGRGAQTSKITPSLPLWGGKWR